MAKMPGAAPGTLWRLDGVTEPNEDVKDFEKLCGDLLENVRKRLCLEYRLSQIAARSTDADGRAERYQSEESAKSSEEHAVSEVSKELGPEVPADENALAERPRIARKIRTLRDDAQGGDADTVHFEIEVDKRRMDDPTAEAGWSKLGAESAAEAPAPAPDARPVEENMGDRSSKRRTLDYAAGDQWTNSMHRDSTPPRVQSEKRRPNASSNSKITFNDVLDDVEDEWEGTEEEGKKDEMSEWQASARNVVTNPSFEIFFAVAILTNACFLGVEVDWVVDHPNEPSPVAFLVIGHLYNFAFVVELCIRMMALGFCKFFTGATWAWNLLDFFIVVSSLVEFVTDIVFIARNEGTGGVSLNNIRLLRMTRIAKMVRLLRIARLLKFFRALRVLVYQIMGTLRSVFWAWILMLIITYVFAMIFVQTVSDFLSSEDSDDRYIMLRKYWGTLPRTMFTLYKSVTGGVDWENVVYPLSDVHWIAVFLFIIFISFILFAVLNTVTGVFCQKAIESASHDQDSLIRDRILEKNLYMKKTRELFLEFNAERVDTVDIDIMKISYAQFEEHMRDERVLAYFAIMGLDHNDAWDLFKLLDSDRDASIDLEEFVRGFMRLRGNAKSIDIAKLQHENKQLRTTLGAFMNHVDKVLEEIGDRVSVLPKGDRKVPLLPVLQV